MRLKRNRLREFKHFQVVQKKDSEGGTYTEYAPPSCFRAEMWTAGGKVQAEMYGSRLPLIRNLRIDGKYAEVAGKNGKPSYRFQEGMTVSVNDGISVNGGNDPDYKVVAIYPYTYLTLEVEKL